MMEPHERSAADRERDRELREAARKRRAATQEAPRPAPAETGRSEPPRAKPPRNKQARNKPARSTPPQTKLVRRKPQPGPRRQLQRRSRRPPRADRGGRHTARRILAVSMLVLAIVIVWLLVSIFQPFGGGAGSGRVQVTVPPDSGTSQVAGILARDGVIGSSFFFKLRAELDGAHFRAGTFAMSHGMSYGAAIDRLTTAPALPQTTNVTIIPGKSRWQLDRLLRSQGVPGSYLKDTIHSPLLNPAKYGAPRSVPSLEGFLYPDTYQLKRPISIPALVTDQLTEFKREFSKVNFSYARSKHLTPYDVLKIASLEEAEAAKPGDLKLVASVIYNRLRLGMNLGLDTTAAYAANNYSGNLTSAQLNSSSPWNTRNHRGLPPTPINSPALDAIQAAAHPASSNYLYFIVKVCGNGSLAFTSSYGQFLQWSQAYQRSLDARGAQKTEFCSSHHG